MSSKERLEGLIQAYEIMISENRDSITKLSKTVSDLRQEIKSSLVRVISGCNVAVKHVEEAVESYKAGKPDGYDELIRTVNDLKNVQDIMLTPFLANLQVSGLSYDFVQALNDKIETAKTVLNNKTAAQTNLTSVNIGMVTPTSGNLISEKVNRGISFVSMIFFDGTKSTSLKGCWTQQEISGSGILTDSEGNAFLVVQEGDNVKIKLLEEAKEQETALITADELAVVKDIAGSGVTAEKLQSMISDINRLKTSGFKTLPVISVGAVTAKGGATAILGKTDDGLNVIKVTIGGVSLVGPWTKESTYGYGLLTDSENNVWKVHLNGLDIVTQKVNNTDDITSSNVVSADYEELLKTISEISNLAQLMVEPGGRINTLEKQVQNLADRISPVTDNVNTNFTKLSDFDNLVNAVGTTSTVDGKNLLQMIFDLKEEVNSLKSNDTSGNTSNSDPAVFNYKGESISPQHETFLKIVKNMTNRSDRNITGNTLISQGLTGLTTRDLDIWIDDFMSNALWCDDIDIFLDSFRINLVNFDSGSILGYDTGSGITLKPSDVVLADREQQLVYPATMYTFSDDKLSGGSYSMRLTRRNGLDILVQMPEQLSKSQRETIKKAVAWYIPASLDLVEKATGLSFNSSTSKLSNVKLLSGSNVFSIFDKKAVVLVFDAGDAAIGVNEPQNGDTVTVNFTVIDNDTKKASAIVFNINGNYYSQISGDNGVGINSAPQTFDRAICHAVATAVFACNISNYDTLPFWFKEGLSSLVYGFDDKVTVDVKELLKSRTRLEKAFSSAPDNYVNWENNRDPAIVGYLFLRYLLSSLTDDNQEAVNYDDLTEGARTIKSMFQHMASSTQQNSAVILDEGIISVTDKFRTASDIKNSFLSALEKSQSSNESVPDFLRRECNLKLLSDINGNVTGKDILETWSYSATNIENIYSASYPSNIIHFNGQPIHFKYVNGTLFMFPDIRKLTEDEQYTLGVIANCYIPNALTVIKKTTGFSFNRKLKVGIIKGTDGIVKVCNTPFIFVTLDRDDISPYSLNENDLIKTTYHSDSIIDGVNLTVSSKYFNKISKDTAVGISYSYPNVTPLSTLILQELLRTALAVNLAGNRYPLWFINGFIAAVSDDTFLSKAVSILSDIKRTETALDLDTQDLNSFVEKTDPTVVGFVILHYFLTVIHG